MYLELNWNSLSSLEISDIILLDKHKGISYNNLPNNAIMVTIWNDNDIIDIIGVEKFDKLGKYNFIMDNVPYSFNGNEYGNYDFILIEIDEYVRISKSINLTNRECSDVYNEGLIEKIIICRSKNYIHKLIRRMKMNYTQTKDLCVSGT